MIVSGSTADCDVNDGRWRRRRRSRLRRINAMAAAAAASGGGGRKWQGQKGMVLKKWNFLHHDMSIMGVLLSMQMGR